ncbi:MAG TPA: universal stress protein [Pyrinomonadaceae bacterium]|nr:universal stress protein [Pyrinomonadaceae bacterium]
MRVLLAVDSTLPSQIAVDEVVNRPWPDGSAIRVISVTQPVPFGLVGLPAEYFNELTRFANSSAENAIQEAVRELEHAFGDAVKVEGEVLSGSPKNVIVDEADKWNADLIVVGASGHSPFERLFGTVADSVIAHAHCSVEIVRHREAA